MHASLTPQPRNYPISRPGGGCAGVFLRSFSRQLQNRYLVPFIVSRTLYFRKAFFLWTTVPVPKTCFVRYILATLTFPFWRNGALPKNDRPPVRSQSSWSRHTYSVGRHRGVRWVRFHFSEGQGLGGARVLDKKRKRAHTPFPVSQKGKQTSALGFADEITKNETVFS